eukprot:TRINITY_DN2291_c0_g1_i1.p1 TRINITY_DN2291_c0_g1~~TRINITY_DN2291_c0_g1_i1.p1  ORF type:complete len:469 (-),score=135.23 TRINITY_DN2291_c0_g1_i1:46-1452(-)
MMIPMEVAAHLPKGSCDMMIRGGNVYKLVQYLTHQEISDLDFMHSFLISYPAFITGADFLKLLKMRFYVRMPPGDHYKEIRTKIRLRVINVMKIWVQLYYQDLAENPEMLKLFTETLQLFEKQSNFKAASTVLKVLEQKTMFIQTQTASVTVFPEPVYLNEPGPLVTIFEFHPMELARQISLIEWDFWKSIRACEFVLQGWTKPTLKDKLAPRISAMIAESNKRTVWFISEIVTRENAKDRAILINKFILTAEAAFNTGNYNTVMEIMSALQNSAIHRLRNSWQLLPPDTWDLFDKFKSLFDAQGNFQVYRDKLKLSVPPCIPYLGTFLTDIVFVCDGNPGLIPDTDLINFAKYRNLTNIIRTIQQFQLVGPAFRPVPGYQKFLADSPLTSLDMERAFERSVELEPNKPSQNRAATMTKEEIKKKNEVEKISKEIFSKEETLMKKAKKRSLKREEKAHDAAKHENGKH